MAKGFCRRHILTCLVPVATLAAHQAQAQSLPVVPVPCTGNAFTTLATAQEAAALGRLSLGAVVTIDGYATSGDGGACRAVVIAQGHPGAHPQADRLRLVGG